MFFEVLADATRAGTGAMQGEHRAFMPGVICNVCGATWGTAGREYPSVDVAGVADRERYLMPDPVPLEQWKQLAARVQPLLPDGLPVLPGTHFGVFVGGARGTFEAFHLHRGWTLFVRAEALAKLQARGVRGLRAVEPKLTFPPRSMTKLLELEVPVFGHVEELGVRRQRVPRCDACGWDGASLPNRFAVAAHDLPADVDLFRLKDFSTVLVCTRRFADAVKESGLQGLAFSELEAR